MIRHGEVRGVYYEAGYWWPQLQIQITPLSWGIALSWGCATVACKLGPIAVCLWWKFDSTRRKVRGGWFDNRSIR